MAEARVSGMYDLFARLFPKFENAARIGIEDFALVGKHDPGVAAINNGGIDETFQIFDMLADRRLGQIHPLRRAGKRALFHQQDQRFKLLHGKVLELIIRHEKQIAWETEPGQWANSADIYYLTAAGCLRYPGNMRTSP